MTYHAHTRITVLRTPSGEDSPTNAWGDPVDLPRGQEPVHLSGVRAALQQETVRQWQPNERRWTEVTTWTARVRRDLDIVHTDQIRDDRTGDRFVIDEIHTPTGFAGWAHTRLQLTRVR
ncbi:hypothetical protein BJF83_20840 [Nocardiopsis sp. CNR-923]|uniref:hypothetical protein n=1 Tax=Nocardiopsis sp. CNR-923 TaxID=1904965 RepID=UPI0009613962|nr:hypothetical protein [Nocardiopsis sp. CNR-923]OLT26535.1 hypothetical protein BJF83_20840 [Nocardiopsis sp. CNR-923]